MEKAQDARTKNDEGAMKDAASLLATNYIQDYMDKRYVQILDGFATTYPNAGTYAKIQFPNATEGGYTYEVSGDILTVSDTKGNSVLGTILDNGNIEWNSTNTSNNNNNNNNQGGGNTGNEEDNPPVLQTIASKRTDSGETVQAVDSTANTTLVDDLGNEVIIPAGFGIASDSGTKVEEGIVIEDATSASTVGSQFVWVPVGTNINVSTSISATGKIDIPLSRYTDEYDNIVYEDGTLIAVSANYEIPDWENEGDEDDVFYTETISNTVARLTSDNTQIEFVKQANEKGGFYIARYEAGLNDATDNYSLEEQTAVDGSVKPVSIKGKGVWNAIARDSAVTVSENMYNNSNYKSDLTSSYAWDTTIVFVEKCGTNSKYLYEKRIQKTLTTTGNASEGSVNDIQCNIYDMASNVAEWTTEYCNNGENYGVRVGGCFKATKNLVGKRVDVTVTSVNEVTGFRPILYIL